MTDEQAENLMRTIRLVGMYVIQAIHAAMENNACIHAGDSEGGVAATERVMDAHTAIFEMGTVPEEDR